jgi:ribosome-binding factor A
VTIREERLRSHYQKLAANFLEGLAEPGTLVTVTDCVISENLRHVTCLLRVFPKQKRDEALLLANRNKRALRDTAAKENRGRFVPDFTFAPDPSEAIDDALGGLAKDE